MYLYGAFAQTHSLFSLQTFHGAILPRLSTREPSHGITSHPPYGAKARHQPSRLRMQTHSVNPIRALPSPSTRFYDFSPLSVNAIRATHCRVLSDELATEIDTLVRRKRSTLEKLASQLSACAETRCKEGDTGFYYFNKGEIELGDETGTTNNDESPPVFNLEFLSVLQKARPGAFTRVRVSYGWELFIVTDMRHGLRPTVVGAPRGIGYPVSGRMRRRSPKHPSIEPRSYFIHTLGCQMNASDTERMASALEAGGFVPTENPMRTALYILNTCALREHAQQKVYSYLGPQAQRKWDAPENVTLIVAGCVAQQEGERLLTQVPEVDIVMGPQYANRIVDVIDEFRLRQAQIVATEPVHIYEDISRPKRTSRVTAWVNIIYGCLERCSYCVVPNTRGLEQSRPMRAIREEVEAAVRDGFKEVILLGQNVDAYGRDLSPKRSLSDLLHFIHDIDGLLRIRFTTGHPRYISDGLINAVATLPKVMEHFHIPPQSGDSKVLRDMRRGYSRERYINIARRIRARLPDASICADMIVGFPGESDAEFQNTVSLTDEVVFDANMVRAYSARPNTTAALRHDQVDEVIKKQRLDIMNIKMKEQALERSRRYLGREVEVLVEDRNEKVEGEMMGRERTNRVVFFPGTLDLVGSVVDVYVEEAFTFSLRGRIV